MVAETCAARGLDLLAPLDVQPMDAFQGGYTPGIGSVTWEADHAQMWREGWCALGVYCTTPKGAQPPSDESEARAGGRDYSRPAGLYDPEKNVLYVRDPDNPNAAATIAHEAVHALQYQHYPRLHAIHLWRNRDLAAAANSATEGDAHVVGWSFDRRRRIMLCSIDPRAATRQHAAWWKWQPDATTALEGFPHVFGTEPALRRMLAGGNRAMDDHLREPPISALQVLEPALAPTVDFIRLPELDVAGCSTGLRNTAGVVGIWGMLRLHGDAQARSDALPALLTQWRGDRFVHLSCPGDGDDELAWRTSWRTVEAATAFADRYRRIADGLRDFGGLLGSVPTPHVVNREVIVITAGLADEVALIAEAEARPFATFSEWFASGCFPDDGCGDRPEPAPNSNGIRCSPADGQPERLAAWLARVRNARAEAGPAEEMDAVLAEVAKLAAFCAVNGSRNTDLLTACRAAYSGVRFVAELDGDPNYRLLPFCLDERDVRRWVQTTYDPAATLAATDERRFTRAYGIGRAANAFAATGPAGLLELARRRRFPPWPCSGRVPPTSTSSPCPRPKSRAAAAR